MRANNSEPKPTVIEVDMSGAREAIAFGKLNAHLRTRNRFFLPDDLEQFVAALVRASTDYRTTRLRRGTRLFRARRHDEVGTTPPQVFDDHNILPPPIHLASGGRINPTGMPCLYAAKAERTAVAEVRPWIDAWLTVAQLRFEGRLVLADFTSTKTRSVIDKLKKKGLPSSWILWEAIDYAFARPVNPGNDLDYLITQYLAESFKERGLDCVMYGSSLHRSGTNVAVFDWSGILVEEKFLVQAKGVQYKYSRHNKT